MIDLGSGDVAVGRRWDTCAAAGHPAPQELVAAFLQATSEAPDDGDLEDHLAVTDGTRTWGPDDLNAVTTVTERDPAWLQHRAAINKLFAQEKLPRRMMLA